MNYASLEFFAFLAWLVPVYWLVGSRGPRAALLLAASLAFYAWSGLFDVAVFLAVVALSYAAARLAGAFPARRGFFLACAVALLALHLVFWKYGAAMASTFAARRLAAAILLPLPLGISFFTFQGVSFLVDYWRGSAQMVGVEDYLLFHALFAHMLAGPIVRAKELMGQLARLDDPTPEDWTLGAALFARGLVKKMLVADRVAPFVDMVFACPGKWGRQALVWGVVGFALQLWGDFSGYTDMGRGAARMLGIRLPENFYSPWLSRTPGEFWERWHVTLSRWARDYVFWPLRDWALAPMVAALLLGLWHGGRWTFFLWGFYFRALAVGEDALERSPFARAWTRLPDAFRRLVLLPLTLSLNVSGVLLFRATSLSNAAEYALALARGPLGVAAGAGFSVGVLQRHFYAAAALTMGMELLFYRGLQDRRWRPFGIVDGQALSRAAAGLLSRRPAAAAAVGALAGAAVAFAGLAAILFRQGEATAFVYFRF